MFDSILANFAWHIELDPIETEHIKVHLQRTTVKKNSELLRAGDVCRNLYFVDRGCLRVFNRDEKGAEHTILFCPENWWAADMGSFSRQTAAFYSISALEETVVVYVSYSVLERLYIDIPKLERFFRILFQNGFSLYQRHMTANVSKTAQERYVRFRRLYPNLEQRITQKQIASYLGITSVFLSMLRRRAYLVPNT